MTSANMKLVILRVPVDDANALYERLPKQFLEQGEFIVPRVIRLDRLQQELQGIVHSLPS
jgi:ADP-ribose diphosphatase